VKRGLLPIVALAVACLAPPASADLLNGNAGGISYYSDFHTSTGLFTLTADCENGGERVLGGGTQGPFFTRTEPFDDEDNNKRPDDGWTFQFDGGSGGGASATVNAMCSGDRPAYVTKRKRIEPGETRVAKAGCPSGTRVVGGGGVIPPAMRGATRINSTFPYDAGDTDTKRDDGWAVRVEDSEAFIGGRIGANAVCLDTRASYVEAQTTLVANGTVFPSPFCPADRHLASVGLESEGDAGQGYVYELLPLDSAEDADNGFDDAAETAITNSPPGPTAPVTATAVCLPPR
jgi:hypothetical protein